MVNAVLLASLIAPIAALIAATVLYIRRRKPRSAPGRRSVILFGLGTLGFGIGGAYLAFQQLPWVFCESPLIFHLSGEWCARTRARAPCLAKARRRAPVGVDVRLSRERALQSAKVDRDRRRAIRFVSTGLVRTLSGGEKRSGRRPMALLPSLLDCCPNVVWRCPWGAGWL